jgi:hypothetical protein
MKFIAVLCAVLMFDVMATTYECGFTFAPCSRSAVAVSRRNCSSIFLFFQTC